MIGSILNQSSVLTEDSTKGRVHKDILLDLMQLCHNIELTVVNTTSDIGSSNRVMWSAFGVSVGRGELVNRIPHLISLTEWLYFVVDVPHLIKSLLVHGISIRPVQHLAKLQA